MSRSAAQHSRAATNAFVKADHFSAHQCSLKAQEKWLAAERLNTKAAKEILAVRNNKNDLWKLDLHGLHAAEAVQVLRQHLYKIESKLLFNRSLSPNRSKIETHMIRSSSVQSFSCAEEKQRASLGQMESSLQVITGVIFLQSLNSLHIIGCLFIYLKNVLILPLFPTSLYPFLKSHLAFTYIMC